MRATRVIASAALAAAIFTTAVRSQQAPAINRTALRGATVVDVVAGTTVSDAVIVIEGDRISAFGGRTTPIPAGATVIVLSGKWVLPGLMDAHTHLTLGTLDYIGAYIRQSKWVRALLGARTIWQYQNGEALYQSDGSVRALATGIFGDPNDLAVALAMALRLPWERSSGARAGGRASGTWRQVASWSGRSS